MLSFLTRLNNYKDLLLVFIWREFVIRYKQTLLGVFWALIQPLAMMALFVFVFGVILQTKLKDYPYVLFFFSGLLPWTFFSSSLNFSINSLSANYNLITKIYFPREIIPLSGIAVAFIDFCIGLLFLFVLLVCYKVSLTFYAFWFIPLMFLMLAFTMALSLLLAALNVYYRDIKLASAFFMQIMFFSSPIIYSIDMVASEWKYLLFLNPLTFIIENMRRTLIEGRDIIWWQFLVEMALILFFFFAAIKIFIRIERKFADVV